MKLIRFGEFKQEKPGVELESGKRIDWSAYFDDWNHDFFAGGGLDLLATRLQRDHRHLPEVSQHVRLGAPIARPGKILGIGLNYSDHAIESGMAPPQEPGFSWKEAANGPRERVATGSTRWDHISLLAMPYPLRITCR